ncbi:uncharacterized mitochondrial protein AtMg00810-like [Cryptomeria japonica]|uniref:uncharacterized mitochondrial protein AtMg00810-like n=1 Tax=Cryptomeria japonica TaxID=3369 RepID=UPI0027DA193D|nr:uncharacterized mitochondrial protein AtMg00810-like [Cryptomeria japonica]
MVECKAFATPVALGEKLTKEDASPKVDATRYRSLVGSLMYLTTTGPDIMYVVILISQFMRDPHSDWAGSVDDRKSTSGYMFSFISGVVSWSSEKQATVAFS